MYLGCAECGDCGLGSIASNMRLAVLAAQAKTSAPTTTTAQVSPSFRTFKPTLSVLKPTLTPTPVNTVPTQTSVPYASPVFVPTSQPAPVLYGDSSSLTPGTGVEVAEAGFGMNIPPVLAIAGLGLLFLAWPKRGRR